MTHQSLESRKKQKENTRTLVRIKQGREEATGKTRIKTTYITMTLPWKPQPNSGHKLSYQDS